MGAKITQWVKSNLTVVVCGTLAALSVILIVLGVILPEAQASLENDQSVYSGLRGVAAKAANEKVIDDLRRKQNAIRNDVQQFLADASKAAPRSLLHASVFPKMVDPFAVNVFKEQCDKKRKELLQLLKADDPPSNLDIQDFEQEMLKAKEREMRQRGEIPDRDNLRPGLLPNSQGPPLRSSLTPSRPPYGGNETFNAGPPTTTIPEGLTPDEWVKQDATAGASIQRARQIYCYANNEALDPRTQIADKYPPVEVMWEAQLSLWIQEDVVQALARLNEEAARQLPEEDRWVSHLPVKRLMYIAVGSYLPKSTGTDTDFGYRSPGRSAGAAIDPADPSSPSGVVFTKRVVAENLDVVHFAVGLVMDANYLVKVIDEIGKAGFYTALLVNYEAIAQDPTFRGYVYGSAPLIQVRLEFEHCLLRDKLMIGDKKYVDLMPASIKAGTYVSNQSSPGQRLTPSYNAPAYEERYAPRRGEDQPRRRRIRDEG